jgi:signal transduction histidine kinase/AmiR/NasT family two-component response regulator
LKRLWSINGKAQGSNPDTAWILASGYAELSRNGELKNVVCWITDISMQKAAAKALNIKMNEALELKRQQENFIDVSPRSAIVLSCTNMAQMISHEIRNPLSAVLHCAEEIERSISEVSTVMALTNPNVRPKKSLQPVTHEWLENSLDAVQTIVHCVHHQKRVVDDVLTLSKLDSDLLTISPIPLQPTSTAREALKLFEGELRTAQIQSAVIEDPSLEKLGVDWVLLDPSRLLQVLINLITNAIKFTRSQEEKKITIQIAASNSRPTMDTTSVDYFPQQATSKNSAIQHVDDDGKMIYLSIAVTDTGKGLSPDEKVRLFQRFVQGSPKTHVEYGGSGLGLFISRQITEMMGGEIGVASEEGRGSTFMFFMKTQIIEESKGTRGYSLQFDSLNPGSEPSRVRFGSMSAIDEPGISRILVVEDNLVNQKVLCKQLNNRGYIVVAANHGGEALEKLYKTASYVGGGDEDAFNVILMDIEMPYMDGLSCVRFIRDLEANGKLTGHIPVVGVTANVRIEHVKAAMEAGMDGVTTKPYRMDELVAQMKTAYRNSQ